MTSIPGGLLRRRSGSFAWFLALLLGVVGVLVGVPGALAYEAPTGAWSPPADGASTVTLPSGVTATVTTSGATSVRAVGTLADRGFADGTFTPAMTATDSSLDVHTSMYMCAVVGTCAGLGTLTVTFNRPVRNPTLHITGLGGNSISRRPGQPVLHQSDHHATLRLVTPGVELAPVSGNPNFAVVDEVVTAKDHSVSLSCVTPVGSYNPARTTASCGSVQLTGTVTSVTFEVGAEIVQNPDSPNPALRMTPTGGDVYSLTVTLPQNYSSAPASYGGGQAPAHVLSDLSLGSSAKETNADVRNSTAPVAGDETDAFDSLPTLVAQPGTPYRLTVPVSGVGRPAHLCGYLDLDRDGTFDTADERACTTAPEGSTRAELVWAVPAGVDVGPSWARFRIGYTREQVASPVGLADSGEVEDHRLTITAANAGITLVTTADAPSPAAAGATVGYTFRVTNTGNLPLTSVAVTDPRTGPVTCPADTLAPGETITCTAGYTLTQDDVDAGRVTATATAAGTDPAGRPVTGTGTVTSSLERRPGVGFVKSAGANGAVGVGDLVPFTFTVTNTGNVTLTQIAVTDPMTGTVTCPATTLAPGASIVCATARYRVTAADVAAGRVVNTATLQASAAGLDQPLNRDASATVRTSEPPASSGPDRAIGPATTGPHRTGAPAATGSGRTSGLLANTGSPVGFTLGLAWVLLGGGAALTVARRRRRSH